MLDEGRFPVYVGHSLSVAAGDIGYLLDDSSPVQATAQVLVAHHRGDILQTPADLKCRHQVVIPQYVAEVEGGSTTDKGAELVAPGE